MAAVTLIVTLKNSCGPQVGQGVGNAIKSVVLTAVEENGVRYVEGPEGQPLMRKVDDIGLVLEACFSAKVNSALLYALNMTQNFFDLSSGEAGVVLQKLQSYGIRLAVVCPPNSVRMSSRFGEVLVEKGIQQYFRVFESAAKAREWLK